MLEIERRLYGLKLKEVYFAPDAAESQTGADVFLLRQSATPPPKSVAFHTLHLDLTQSEDALEAGLSKSNRYKIRRAANRDGVTCTHVDAPTDDDIAAFVSFYEAFAAAKGVEQATAERLSAFRDRGGLALSAATGEDGQVLCRHSYLMDGHRAWLLHSASHRLTMADSGERNLIGRANRLLHWRDILHFRDIGLRVFDFGGFGGESASAEVQRIDEFKLSFGGRHVTEYDGARPETLVGRLALLLRKH